MDNLRHQSDPWSAASSLPAYRSPALGATRGRPSYGKALTRYRRSSIYILSMRNLRRTPSRDKRLEALRALADPTRLRILELLKKKGCCSCEEIDERAAGMCVCDLEQELGLSQPTITHHLQVLRHAELVECVRIGTWLYCRRNEVGLRELGSIVAGL